MFKIKLIKKPHKYKNYRGLWYKLIQTEEGVLKWEVQEKLDGTGNAWYFTADTPIDEWYIKAINDMKEDTIFERLNSENFKILSKK